MQNLKYHSLNVISIMIFSFMLASTINQVIKYNLSPGYTKAVATRRSYAATARKNFDDYKIISESGFFKVASAGDMAGDILNPAGSISELTLLGTISGPTSIARAMILKSGEKSPGVFALYKVNTEVGNDVYGNKLVGIGDSKVYLDAGGQRVALELYAKKVVDSQSTPGIPSAAGGQQLNQTLSRAEMKQKVFNNMDNALQGLQAGPHRVNGQIVGYRLITVRPQNIMFRLGARSGDIIKRVNGQVLDSTQKLMSMWEMIKNDPKITIDLERGGKNLRYDFNITD